MDRLALLKFLLLAFALPAQYLISEYWSYNTAERSQALKTYSLAELNLNFYLLTFFFKELLMDLAKLVRIILVLRHGKTGI